MTSTHNSKKLDNPTLVKQPQNIQPNSVVSQFNPLMVKIINGMQMLLAESSEVV